MPFKPFDPTDAIDPETGEALRTLPLRVEIAPGYVIPASHYFEFLSFITNNHDVRQAVVDIALLRNQPDQPRRKLGVAAFALSHGS